MGKALLIMVLGTGLYIAISQFGTQDALVQTAERQGHYDEGVIAREIARSGFNVGMGIIRPFGANLLGATNAVNGAGGVMSGEHQGGEYRVRARLVNGSTIELTSAGYYGGHWVHGQYVGGARNVMSDRYTIPVLSSRQCSVLKVKFLQSQAGYCSAIYLQRYPFGQPLDSPPTPEMLFAASHNADYDTLTVTKYIDAGTQMNFFIGVDQNCSTRPANPRGYDVLHHVYNPHDYDYVHYALDIDVERMQEMKESVWALVEQHPDDNQRWRIGWEDIHNTSWDDPDGTDPRSSLQALKLYGYDTNNDGRGDGWSRLDAYGYRLLRDGQLDLSDQVVEVRLYPVDPAITGGVCNLQLRLADGGGDITPGGGDDDGGGGSDDGGGSDSGGGSDDGGGSGTDTGSGGDDGGSIGGGSSGTGSGGTEVPDCPCPRGNNNKKVYVMHYPQGNMSNPQTICIAREGWYNGHDRHNGDFIICEGN